jgi:hypothetical protein
MRTTETQKDYATTVQDQTAGDDTLVSFASRQRPRLERFPDVEDLVERLTDDTASVARWG